MGMAKKLLQGLTRRAVTKTMDRVGGRLVSRIADTSADAPSSFTEPKRDLYRHMVAGEARADGQASAEVAPDAPADDSLPEDAAPERDDGQDG